MNKKRRRRRGKGVSEIDSALRASYLQDPIALWQDGECEILDALFAHEEEYASPPIVQRSEVGTTKDRGDSLPF
jgi:hypothetical protein